MVSRMDHDFSLKPHIDYKIYHLGPEKEPIVVIDGLMNNPASVVEYAASQGAYGPAGAAYPGIRCPVPLSYIQNVRTALSQLWTEVFNVPAQIPLRFDATFSLVTEAPKTLRHNQRVPHTDQSDLNSLAMVHYLCGPQFSGTSFFRHRQTGWQRIDKPRVDEYNKLLNRELNTQVLKAGFPDGSHPFFEILSTVTPSFDRLIMYRASILHSPAIREDEHYSRDPKKGRLTITGFLNPQ